MDPITLIAGASTIVKALGLDEKIGKLLGGAKGAEVAQSVMRATQAVTGGLSPEATVEALAKDAELWHTLRREVVATVAQLESMDAQDTTDARKLQAAALAQDDLFSKRFVYYFAAAWSLFAMGYLVLITVTQIPEANQRFADTTLGFLLGTIIATIIVYFYGSSKGSHSKDGALREMIEELRNRK